MVERSPCIQEGGLERVLSAHRAQSRPSITPLAWSALAQSPGQPQGGPVVATVRSWEARTPFPSVAEFVPNPFRPGITAGRTPVPQWSASQARAPGQRF